MIIRPPQIAIMQLAMREHFEARMRSHLWRFFPGKCEALGDPQVREAIGLGINKSASYTLSSERDTCKFIDLMFTLGFDFDKTDPWHSAFRLLPNHAAFDRRFDELYDNLLSSEPSLDGR